MSLPGHATRNHVQGEVCEECHDNGNRTVPATVRVQGETDSFGCEYIYFCEEHYKKFKDKGPERGNCECCGTECEIIYTRDWEEGMNGPVYRVCEACHPRYLDEDWDMEEDDDEDDQSYNEEEEEDLEEELEEDLEKSD